MLQYPNQRSMTTTQMLQASMAATPNNHLTLQPGVGTFNQQPQNHMLAGQALPYRLSSIGAGPAGGLPPKER